MSLPFPPEAARSHRVRQPPWLGAVVVLSNSVLLSKSVLLSASVLLSTSGCTARLGDDTADTSGSDTSDSDTSGSDTSGSDTSDSGQETADSADPGLLRLDNANNYRYTSAITIAVQTVHAGEDTKVDWSGLTEDLLGHPIDPATGVSLLGLAVLPNLSPAEATEKLAAGMLVQEDISIVYTLNTRGTTVVRLSEFRDLSANFDPATDLVPTEGAYLLVVQPISRPGAATLTFVDPTVDAPSGDIVLTNETAVVTFTPTIPAPLPVPTTGPWGADWAGLTTGGGGAPIAYTPIDGLWIARYDTLAPGDLAAHFLDLEGEADGLWKLTISAADSADDLTAATATDGSPFPGFSAGSTWALALRCGSCVIAAPPYFVALEPTP